MKQVLRFLELPQTMERISGIFREIWAYQSVFCLF